MPSTIDSTRSFLITSVTFVRISWPGTARRWPLANQCVMVRLPRVGRPHLLGSRRKARHSDRAREYRSENKLPHGDLQLRPSVPPPGVSVRSPPIKPIREV